MPPPRHRPSPVRLRLATAALLAACAAVAGCDDRLDRIRSYTVPKEAPPPLPPPGGPPGPSSPAAVAALPELTWDLPDGWQTAPNPNAMRFATLLAGDGEQVMEVAVTRLGGAAGGVAANINRWRGQVGLAPAEDAEIAQTVIPIEGAEGVRGVMVDLAAPGEDPAAPRMLAAVFPSRSETWFIKATGRRDVLATHRPDFEALCRSTRFDAATVAVPPTAGTPSGPGGGPTWPSLPEGWTADATPAAMSVASITVAGDGGEEASLTITPLGGEQDMLANINRWRRQLGLPPASDPAESGAVPIEVDGAAGTLVDLGGDGQHTIAVISRRDDATWFFKLTGPGPLVAGQRDAFEAFIRSIRFEAPAS